MRGKKRGGKYQATEVLLPFYNHAGIAGLWGLRERSPC